MRSSILWSVALLLACAIGYLLGQRTPSPSARPAPRYIITRSGAGGMITIKHDQHTGQSWRLDGRRNVWIALDHAQPTSTPGWLMLTEPPRAP